MEEKKDVIALSKEGLCFLYFRLGCKKRKLAIEFCNALLKEIDGWETYYKNAKRCISRSPFYGYKIVESDLSETEKIVFFWKVISEELQNWPKEFLMAFPEEYHKYSEDNFKRLYDYVLHSKHWWNNPFAPVGKQAIDGESDSMNAIKDGEDW